MKNALARRCTGVLGIWMEKPLPSGGFSIAWKEGIFFRQPNIKIYLE
jgi:hypothetical protein